MKDLIYKIALTQIYKVGGEKARQLVSYCGGVEGVFKAKKSHLLKIPGIGEQTANHILNANVFKKAEEELAFVEKHKIQVLFYLDKAYPQRLKHYSDSPILLYYKGNADLNARRIVSVIGTRKATDRGKAICEELVSDLVPYQPLIISGLAYGIDVTAHRKALEVGLETVGVMGCGLGQVYPASHRNTAAKMVKQGGLLTEFISSKGPEMGNFPARNRIIAGMCDAVIVVETAYRGGSMITAYKANDYNKDVFAVPGRLKDEYSQGCNLLIKSHKAALMEKAEDIGYIMRWETKENPVKQRQILIDFTKDEQVIVDLLKTVEKMEVDKLSYQSKFSPSKLAGVLFNLELKGAIKNLPGKQYMLV